jgi:SAM-dependent methyltransferase
MTSPSPRQALSFGAAAGHYHRIRPSYPADAVRWCLHGLSGPDGLVDGADGGLGSAGRVVDLGAGTGLLIRVILAVTDATVIPVEPDPLMRAELAENTPGVTPLEGRDTSIPVADGSVDAVLVGQAYHWFDRDRAHAEIGRALRPGGAFAPIWNIRDESVDWVSEYSRLVDDGGQHGHDGQMANPDFGPLFSAVETSRFRHSVAMNADGLVALLASRSYYLTATAEHQAQLTSSIRSLASTLPETFEMPYVTYCYRAIRR